MQPSVRLRPVESEDLTLLLDLWNDPDKAGEHSWSGFRTANRIRRAFEDDGYLGEDGGRLMVVDPDDGTVFGDVSWISVDNGPPPYSRCWNMGISLLPEHRGRGIGTAAQIALVAYLFATTTVERVEASTDAANAAEQRALEKAGFTREGVLRRTQWRHGSWHDMVLYARLRGE